mmetsp:Transcript_9464/g.28228  ORF Transcript_9464/g.28228 Transcript_9464/m.28228 type:complete len:126 (-) Transcript_9464:650-1027(-)
MLMFSSSDHMEFRFWFLLTDPDDELADKLLPLLMYVSPARVASLLIGFVKLPSQAPSSELFLLPKITIPATTVKVRAAATPALAIPNLLFTELRVVGVCLVPVNEAFTVHEKGFTLFSFDCKSPM